MSQLATTTDPRLNVIRNVGGLHYVIPIHEKQPSENLFYPSHEEFFTFPVPINLQIIDSEAFVYHALIQKRIFPSLSASENVFELTVKAINDQHFY